LPEAVSFELSLAFLVLRVILALQKYYLVPDRLSIINPEILIKRQLSVLFEICPVLS